MDWKIFLIIFILLFSCSKGEDGIKSGKPESGKSAAADLKKEVLTSSDIKNSPPRIVSSKFLPPVPKKGDSIEVEVKAEDSDGDIISFEYEWSRGGVVFQRVSGNILDTDLSRGDKIFVKITPYDGQSEGTQVVSWVAVANSYPDISTELVDVLIKKDKCQAKVNASDADEDELTYLLKNAPEGMTIDSRSGVLNWDFNPGGGVLQHELTVSVKDTFEAETELSISIEGCFPENK